MQVDTGLPHLDRPFEYTVPTSMADTAAPGVRVKVRFAGQDLDGFVLERRADAEHLGRLSPLRRVVSPEPVLTPQVLATARAVADRYAGSLGDVLRLAVPPRHAAAEKALAVGAARARRRCPSGCRAAWSAVCRRAGVPVPPHLGRCPHRLAARRAVGGRRARDWPVLLAEAARAAVEGGRGAVLVVPDHRDVVRVEAALRRGARAGPAHPAHRRPGAAGALHGLPQGAARPRAGGRRHPGGGVRAGARPRPGRLVGRRRRPARRAAGALPARARGAAGPGAACTAPRCSSAGFGRSVAVADLVARGALTAVEAPRETLRRAVPSVRVAGEGHDADRDPAVAAAHLPTIAWRTAKEALERGPVLVQVPRRGYLPVAVLPGLPRARPAAPCAPGRSGCPGRRGRRPAGGAAASRPASRCPACGGHRLRSSVVGARRTAEELGRAFPGVPVERSGAGTVLETVAAGPRLVVSTPGAEPVAPDGYAAALLLDAWALLERPSLTAGEEALRRWLAAAALVRPASEGGRVVLAGAPTEVSIPAVEALVRWDPAWFAERELEERRELALPPAVAARGAHRRPAGRSRRPPPSSTCRPRRPCSARCRTAPPTAGAPSSPCARPDGPALARELAAMRARASARKDPDPVSVRVDPRTPRA